MKFVIGYRHLCRAFRNQGNIQDFTKLKFDIIVINVRLIIKQIFSAAEHRLFSGSHLLTMRKLRIKIARERFTEMALGGPNKDLELCPATL